MAITEYLAEALLNQIYQGSAFAFPSTLYFGLLIAPTYTSQYPTAASITPAQVTAGTYVIGSAFTTSNRHIFKATQTGLTSGAEPNWNQAVGGTTNDGTVVWTECAFLFDAGNFTGAEASGNNYARGPGNGAGAVCNSTNWNAATAGPPAQITNKAVFVFNTPSNTGWGQAVATITADAATNGNILAYQLLSVPVGCGGGSVPTFPATAFGVALGNPSPPPPTGTAGP